MRTDLIQEARRQAEICNACRYCEGYCSVFPALHSQRAFAEGDITQLANLCHNCRGCYYACQYTAPHEFDLNLPKALAEVRRDSWESLAWPQPLAKRFHTQGGAIAMALVAGFALMFLAIRAVGSAGGDGFYAVLSHSAMVALFAPALLLPLFSIGLSLRAYWRMVDGRPLTLADLNAAFNRAAHMTDLAAGHGEGCNFEDEDRFSQSRRYAHQAILYGFLLCFAATCAGTILHYLFNSPAPYPFWSLPKLLGIPGGALLTLGCAWMTWLKLKSDRTLGDPRAWGGDIGFTLLLGFTGLSGLMLFAVGDTAWMPGMLALHLGAVLTFFLLMPFTKMAHGFYRTAALLRNAQRYRE
ncbi:tricarballylate utilization 4Fe-4S protein TcuB [Ruegeria sp. 2205SS24-7]|uniref:tricarballylate utilization 4Fe-4S protein TcuB n=1 Tax=Ruegeria discodermiae TaxID=3064389 RepID=UPI002740B1C1|nr:tricarballylate utilization 4Fe-4S protein TcuB [Ruegeria sp. 2205SS24-7]MDP5219178.1 tricarballylate utilization 4Fe-4S protein TcuB [Ruegeria sp. 2205SS24-7]